MGGNNVVTQLAKHNAIILSIKCILKQKWIDIIGTERLFHVISSKMLPFFQCVVSISILFQEYFSAIVITYGGILCLDTEE